MTAAVVVELLHDAFIEEFNERRAEAYFSRFMETGEPWTFETLSEVAIEVTETRTTLPRIRSIAAGSHVWLTELPNG